MQFPHKDLCSRALEVIENNILPLTRDGVTKGNKIFGAAILRKTDLSLVVANTNAETQNPLFHGEISTLNSFFKLPSTHRPPPSNCIFISTHEPCSLCLSAITWTNFDNFYYFFGYDNTRDDFNIPHDLKILEEVFNIKNGDYCRKNQFWESKNINSMIDEVTSSNRDELIQQAGRIKTCYVELSKIYQNSKENSDIPLS